MSKPIVYMMLGHAGAGKSYFARQLAERIGAVRLNADAMRHEIAEVTGVPTKEQDKKTAFASMRFFLRTLLSSGITVVFDVQHKRVSDRASSREIADELNAAAILIWVRTPLDVAIERGVSRPEAADTRQQTHESMKALIEKQLGEIEEPTKTEKVISIDGTLEFENQYRQFQEQM